MEVRLNATCQRNGGRLTVPGFWDGGGTCRIRFAPPSAVNWTDETRGNQPALDRRKGFFEAGSSSPGNHGPVEVFKTFYLHYAEGAPYHSFGMTCYAWIHRTAELLEQTLLKLTDSPFNKIRFCISPKGYAYNQNEPERFAFQTGEDGKSDLDRPDPVFWRHLERHLLDLRKLGIEVNLILWHPYNRWGFASMRDEQDNPRRYGIAHLSAFSICLVVAGQRVRFYDPGAQGAPRPQQWEDWDRFFSILEKENSFQHLPDIHNSSRWYDHPRPWVTYASLQTFDRNGGVRFRKYRNTVLYDGRKYEENIPQEWGDLDGQIMIQRLWLGTLNRCYVGQGETCRDPQDILWWSDGGVLRGEGLPCSRWLKEFTAKVPPFDVLQPVGDDKGRFVLARRGGLQPGQRLCGQGPTDPHAGLGSSLQGGCRRSLGNAGLARRLGPSRRADRHRRRRGRL